MNIEEERKAFDKLFIYSEERFEIWLAAKNYAAEMGKPSCIIFETMGGTFTVQYFDQGRPKRESGFTNKEDAEVWARNSGYRIVEE